MTAREYELRSVCLYPIFILEFAIILPLLIPSPAFEFVPQLLHIRPAPIIVVATRFVALGIIWIRVFADGQSGHGLLARG